MMDETRLAVADSRVAWEDHIHSIDFNQEMYRRFVRKAGLDVDPERVSWAACRTSRQMHYDDGEECPECGETRVACQCR